MAEDAPAEYSTAEEMIFPRTKRATNALCIWYSSAVAHVTNIVLGRAIGAVAGHWLLAFAVFVIATVAALHGFLTGARGPSACMVILSLLLLGFASLG
jgi:hypothetical protein